MNRLKTTPICYTFLILCILVSIPSAFFSAYFEIFSGELPHVFWWQNFTMVFLHGAKGIPIAVLLHLLLNAALLLTCGRMVEKLLGSSRFLILSLLAWVVFIMTQVVSGIWINGSSGVIWAYSPFLLIFLKGDTVKEIRQREMARGLLITMWGIITIAMGFVPLLFNPNHSLLYTFFFGNLFHLTATLTGFILYLYWKVR